MVWSVEGPSTIFKFLVVTLLSAFLISLIPNLSSIAATVRSLRAYRATQIPIMSANISGWRQALESLPSTPEKIPSFFFAHGSPMLAFPASELGIGGGMAAYHGPTGPLAKFLADFGPILLEKYKPKGIVVFSAHWETHDERQGTLSTLRVNLFHQ